MALLVITAAFLLKMPFELAPETDGGEIQIRMHLDDGTNIAILHQYMEKLDARAREVLPIDDVLFVTNDIRIDRVVIRLTMKKAGERSVSSTELADTIRKHLPGQIAGAEIQVAARSGLSVLRRTFGGGNSDGVALELQLRGNDLAVTENIAREIFARIQTVPGVAAANASTRERRPQRSEAGEIIPVSTLIAQQQASGPSTISRADSQRVAYITANFERGAALGDVVSKIQTDLADITMPEGFNIFMAASMKSNKKRGGISPSQ